MEITVEKTTWQGCQYYAVRPYVDFWRVDSASGTWPSIESWCLQTFGDCGNPWNNAAERWYYNNSKIFIRNESDLALFMLRWR
jgi:hypothetical protein